MGRDGVKQAADSVYGKIKAEIFDFRLLPGDRFTETELAGRYAVSRTPVRDALYRLKQEGYVDVKFRSGWLVCPFDFLRFDALYDLRIVLEAAAVERLCLRAEPFRSPALEAVWLVPGPARESDPRRIGALDEAFHCTLLEAAGNPEMARVHAEVTEKIRIIRRLDFLKEQRVDATYAEHAQLLQLLRRRQAAEAVGLLRAHITASKQAVREITVHMLHEARATAAISAAESPETTPA